MNSGIEVLKVVGDKDNVNICSRPEVIPIEDIKSFRAWHKGKNDYQIKGEMTVIVLRPKRNEEVVFDETLEEKAIREKKEFKTILIEESFASFRDRMATKIPIRKLQDGFSAQNNA